MGDPKAKENRSCGCDTRAVQKRLERLLNQPYELERVVLSEESRLRLHQELVRVFEKRSNEVPAYAAIREWVCANQKNHQNAPHRV